MPPSVLTIRPADNGDLAQLQAIRAAAFAPIFAAFRSILGDAIYEVAQAGDDEAQELLLDSFFRSPTEWQIYAAEASGHVVGFLSLRLDENAGLGEIGLNAVHPDYAGRGFGTAMYEFALDRMVDAGVQVATVSTGGDPSHAAARRAYAKAGFTTGIPSVWLCCDLNERRGRP